MSFSLQTWWLTMSEMDESVVTSTEHPAHHQRAQVTGRSPGHMTLPAGHMTAVRSHGQVSLPRIFDDSDGKVRSYENRYASHGLLCFTSPLYMLHGQGKSDNGFAWISAQPLLDMHTASHMSVITYPRAIPAIHEITALREVFWHRVGKFLLKSIITHFGHPPHSCKLASLQAKIPKD